MKSQSLPSKTLASFFPADDGRLAILAFCALSYNERNRLGSWAWLLQAQGKDKAMLCADSAVFEHVSHFPYAALAALGRYLGFPARVVALLPKPLPNLADFSETPFAMEYSQFFHEHDPQKSHLTIGPACTHNWPGFLNLRHIANHVARNAEPGIRQIVERCGKCGEFKLDGFCGCERGILMFPPFTVKAHRKCVPNLVLKYNLQEWAGRYEIDYGRKSDQCPHCHKPLMPVAANAASWKCTACGSEFDCARQPLLPRRPISRAGAMAPVSAKQGADLPSRVLNAVSKRYPGIWKRADEMRQAHMKKNGQLPWDSDIFMPGYLWNALLRECQKFSGVERSAKRFYQLMAAGTWRPTQDIIRIEPAVYKSLITTPLDGPLPYHTLLRFPAWCMYFDAPGLELAGTVYDGFFAMLDNAWGHRHLCLYFLSEEGEYYLQPIRLGNWDLQEGFISNWRSSRAADGIQLAKIANRRLVHDPGVTAAINIILYAFTEMNAVHVPGLLVNSRPQPKKTKQGWRMFPPPKPVFHTLGGAISQHLQSIPSSRVPVEGHRSGPCPHIRRGHWHHYWKGPKKSILDLKWLPPIPVAMGEVEELGSAI